MKRIILILGALTAVSSYAQQNGRVGINTTAPDATLHVKSQTGSTSTTKNLELENASGTKLVSVLDNGNVGINNTAPTTKLDINNGSTNGAIKIVDGTQGAGKVLTSDASGLGTWQIPAEHSTLHVKQSAVVTENLELASGVFHSIPGITGFTAQKSGKYLIIYHSFLRALTSGTKSFYFYVYKNGNRISWDETYDYIEANRFFNTHYFTIINANAGDLITYQIQASIGAPLVINPHLANRNSVEVVYLGI